MYAKLFASCSERVSCGRFFTLQRLKMNQKREASREASRPQSTKNACFVDAMSTSTFRRRKLIKTLGSSRFGGLFPTVVTFFVKSPENSVENGASIRHIPNVAANRKHHRTRNVSTCRPYR
jgi:hypothetical protein